MQVSWPVLVPVGVLLVLLLIFIIMRNRKDEKEFEGQLDQDFGKPRKHQDNEDTSA